MVICDKCIGCGACMNICPTNAIKMQLDEEGFYKPEIGEDCISCRLCRDICPTNNPQYLNNPEPECYAFMASDEVRMRSASGGAFEVLADCILEKEGYVCGVVWEDDFSGAYHTITNRKADLHKMQGSKYFQSDTRNVFSEIKELLEDNKYVLFSGCPCQVAGLYAVVGRDYEKLVTVDLICHAVPSVKAWRRYLYDISKNRNIKSFTFRCNDTARAWHSSAIKAVFDNGEEYLSKAGDNIWYQTFLRAISINSNCTVCVFNRIPRQGDVTIGDFWGIEPLGEKYNDEKGTSVLLANNEKGNKIICSLQNTNVKLLEKQPLDSATRKNTALTKNMRLNSFRKRFFLDLFKHPFQKHAMQTIENKYDVAIVGLWFGSNYGSILTYYALAKFLEDEGYSVIFLDKPKQMWRANTSFNTFDTTSGKFFRSKFMVCNPKDDYRDWANLNDVCDTFIVGSDVVFNRKISNCGNHFFLDFVDNKKRKISYASSFGEGHMLKDDKEINLTSYYLKCFDAVSIREKEGVEICKNTFNVTAVEVLDPVFLCNPEYYDEEIKKSSVQKSDFISAYFLYICSPDINKFLETVSEITSQKICITTGTGSNYGELADSYIKKGWDVLPKLSLSDFLYYLKNNSILLCSSFHGLCFAIIFRKNFIMLLNKNDKSHIRMQNLIANLGLESRTIPINDGSDFSVEKEKIVKMLNAPVNYDTINEKLSRLKDFSANWLRDALLKDPLQKKYHDVPNVLFNISYEKWGLNKRDPSIGVSVGLVNNETGDKALNNIPKADIALKKAPLNGLVENGYALNKPAAPVLPANTTKPQNYGKELGFIPLQFVSSMSRFYFDDPAAFEEHFIHGMTTLIVKDGYSQRGIHAMLPLSGSLKKDKRYKLSIRFKIKTTSTDINFHIYDSATKKYQIVLPVKLFADDTFQEYTCEFTPNTDAYDSFMVDAFHLSGEGNYLALEYVGIT